MNDGPSREPVAAIGFLGFGVLIFALSLVLVWFSWLRENPLFWRSVGGYPVSLRELVKFSYYPLLFLTVAGLFTMTFGLLLKAKVPLAYICLQVLVIAACWGMLLASLLISFGDNIENLWNGRPLHDDPPFEHL